MNARHRGAPHPGAPHRSALGRGARALLTGLAGFTALTAVGPSSGAATAATTSTGWNEQVALVNETNAQHDHKSHLNGTADVTTHNGGATVFSTDAALVPWDTNQTEDVYLRVDGVTVLVSGRGQRAGNGASFEPTISGDGRHVAFTTAATDLVKGKDRNKDVLDVVVKDMQTDTITRVSQSTAGFQRDKNSFFPVISGNGKHVAFQTFGSFSRKDDDNREDVYVRSLRAGTTRQASLLPSINRDVKHPVLVGDISDNGRIVTFGNDQWLWARDMKAGETVRFWAEPAGGAPCQPFDAGTAGRPVVSGNGRYVAFSTCSEEVPGAAAGTRIVRLDLATFDWEVVVGGDGSAYLPSLSRNGRYLGFGSDADDLVEGDDEGQPDAFRADLETGAIERASQGPDGAGGDSWSGTTAVAISGDGHALAYTSYADNLVAGDSSDMEEAFVWHDAPWPTD